MTHQAVPDLPAAPARSGVRIVLHAGLFALAYFIGAELAYALSLGPSVGGIDLLHATV